MKKICVSGIGFCSEHIAKAIVSTSLVKPLDYNHKKEAKKKKKLLRELAKRQRNLDKLNNAR